MKGKTYDLNHDLTFSAHTGPLHVLWQASFGCWVTRSISSWQEYNMSFFFPKLTDGYQNSKLNQNDYFSLDNLAKLTFLSISSFKNVHHWKVNIFLSYLVKGKSKKIESINFAECSGLSCWNRKISSAYHHSILGKKKFVYILLLSAWDRSRDSTAKRNLSKDM